MAAAGRVGQATRARSANGRQIKNLEKITNTVFKRTTSAEIAFLDRSRIYYFPKNTLLYCVARSALKISSLRSGYSANLLKYVAL
jgi:hypothetical protein